MEFEGNLESAMNGVETLVVDGWPLKAAILYQCFLLKASIDELSMYAAQLGYDLEK